MYTANTLIRVCLHVYSSYHDERFEYRFTDIDYFVFSDAARMMLEKKSPYDRHTYRYSPLLAFMMLPNITLHPECGKLLFSVFDILTGYMLEKTIEKGSEFLSALWLLNPFIILISARGNADCLICFFVIATVFFLKKDNIFMAAVFYGISVHFKIYPIIYALPIMLYLYSDAIKDFHDFKSLFHNVFHSFMLGINRKQLCFAITSASVFFLASGISYYFYGYEFIYESYLHHYVRQDHRHNFSIYYNYMYYLVDTDKKMSPIISFLPQLVCLVCFGMLALRDLEISLFLQSISFVSLNKVCTCQYYLWWICLIPLALPKMKNYNQSAIRLACAIGSFVVANVIWLFFAYHMEIKGYNTIQAMFYASSFFVVSQMAIGWVILQQVASAGLAKMQIK